MGIVGLKLALMGPDFDGAVERARDYLALVRSDVAARDLLKSQQHAQEEGKTL